KLMDQVARRISDGAMLHIIRQFLDAGIMEDSEIHSQDRGTPQGSPLSPLLANIYLNQLDKQWKASGLQNRHSEDAHLIRFADDCAPRRKWKENVMYPELKRPNVVSRIHDIGVPWTCLIEDGGRPPEPPCRRRFQTTVCCCSLRGTVVSDTGKGLT
ncbi:RNA-directed DNA polymerase (Reverse transcriptase), partial [mine drainage metagenome]